MRATCACVCACVHVHGANVPISESLRAQAELIGSAVDVACGGGVCASVNCARTAVRGVRWPSLCAQGDDDGGGGAK